MKPQVFFTKGHNFCSDNNTEALAAAIGKYVKKNLSQQEFYIAAAPISTNSPTNAGPQVYPDLFLVH